MNDVGAPCRGGPLDRPDAGAGQGPGGDYHGGPARAPDQGAAGRYRAAPRRHRQIVAKLEQALRERPEEMLSIPDLCAEVGVARRTFNLACEEFLGEGATPYARGRRLDHVRHRRC